MSINETLANGLKDRLWNELEDINVKTRHLHSQYLKAHKIKLGSRKSFHKLNEMFQLGFSHNILSVIRVGSREDPLLVYAILGQSKEPIKQWEEKMFSIFYVTLNALGKFSEPSRVVVRIGEHAVSRVLLRHPKIENHETKEFEIFNVMDEFRDVAFFAQAMRLFTLEVLKDFKHPLDTVSFPFVSKNGMFIGNINVELNTFDIRTYIANDQLYPEQETFAKLVRTTIEDKRFVGLPFILHLTNYESALHINVLFFIRLFPVVTQLVEIMGRKLGDIAKQDLKRVMDGYFSELEQAYHEIFEKPVS